MNMNGRSLFLGLAICLLAFDAIQAQIALSTYISTADVMASLGVPKGILKACRKCGFPVIQPVLSDDNTVTQYMYTFCADRKGFTLNVGTYASLIFKPEECETFQFLALDKSKSTYAAQFYWDCKQLQIYKCKGNLVFDQPTGRCVQGGYLSAKNTDIPDYCSDISESLLKGLYDDQDRTELSDLSSRSAAPAAAAAAGSSTRNGFIGLPLTALGCESLLRGYVPSYCETCKTPLVQRVLTPSALSADRERTQFVYTYCADTGRFSFDIVNDSKYPYTFFAPDCRGKNLVALDPSRKSVAAGIFWDCSYGLRYCPTGEFFDPTCNRCTPFDGDEDQLANGLENCPKTCGAVPFLSYNTAQLGYTPAPYAPKAYAGPTSTSYGK